MTVIKYRIYESTHIGAHKMLRAMTRKPHSEHEVRQIMSFIGEPISHNAKILFSFGSVYVNDGTTSKSFVFHPENYDPNEFSKS